MKAFNNGPLTAYFRLVRTFHLTPIQGELPWWLVPRVKNPVKNPGLSPLAPSGQALSAHIARNPALRVRRRPYTSERNRNRKRDERQAPLGKLTTTITTTNPI